MSTPNSTGLRRGRSSTKKEALKEGEEEEQEQEQEQEENENDEEIDEDAMVEDEPAVQETNQVNDNRGTCSSLYQKLN